MEQVTLAFQERKELKKSASRRLRVSGQIPGVVYGQEGAVSISVDAHEFTLRFGFNHGNDPIPDRYLNCLFPATVENHLTLGWGWAINAHSAIDFSYTHGFEQAVTNGQGIRVKHSQNNAQVAYSYFF